MAKTEILFPIGRLVGGSLYKGRDKDDKGEPLVYKKGPNAGQPRTEFSFGVAFAKTQARWQDEPWGRPIYAAGVGGAGQQWADHPTFAWKITDGDSTIPNKRLKKPCDRDGYPGHWVLYFSSAFAPVIYNRDGSQKIVEPDAVKLGYYVQVLGDVEFNGSTESPGVYLNFSMVAFSAYGEEIVVGRDAASVGFGQDVTLPAGATAAPTGGMTTPPPVPGSAQTPPPPAAGPTAVTPAPGFLNPPPAANPPAPPAPAAPVYKLGPNARPGDTVESVLTWPGFTPETLIAGGYLAQ